MASDRFTGGWSGGRSAAGPRGPGRGALETLAVLVGFVTLGLGWAELERLAPSSPPWPNSPYPLRVVSDGEPAPRVWLVDGFNVLHAALLAGRDRAGWWRAERRAEVVELAGSLERALGSEGAEVWVVFDGREDDVASSGSGDRVRQVFAPSADAWLVARVRESPDPTRIAVVTADRQVAERSRHRGARVVSPRDFVERCRTPT